MPVSFGLAGILTTQLQPERVLLACGILLAVMSLLLPAIPGLSTIGSEAETPSEAGTPG